MGIQELLSQYGDKYIQALFVTWKLTAVSFVIAFLIGILITVMRVCPVKPLRWVGDFYVQIFRNIPGATLLIMLVYALPYLNMVLSYYTCVLTATSLLPAAFCSEYLMAGMNTVSIGQIEAARASRYVLWQDSEKCSHSPGPSFQRASHDQSSGGDHADDGAGFPGAHEPHGSDRSGVPYQYQSCGWRDGFPDFCGAVLRDGRGDRTDRQPD